MISNPSKPKRLVLPYHDPQSQAEGLQFGMPPDQDTDAAFENSILLVHGGKSGKPKVKIIRRPLLKHPPGELPEPIWLWSRVGGAWQRVGCPERTGDSVPIRDLGDREDEIVLKWSPSGGDIGADMTFGRHIPTSRGQKGKTSGVLTVDICGHPAFQAIAEDGLVQKIVPTKLAWDLRLWTAHLIQLTQVHVAKHTTVVQE